LRSATDNGVTGSVSVSGGDIVRLDKSTAVAYFIAHAPRGFFPLQSGGNGGELAVLYCFAFLYLWIAGGGEWSLDWLLRRDPTSVPVVTAGHTA
jgi:hypothetical protein